MYSTTQRSKNRKAAPRSSITVSNSVFLLGDRRRRRLRKPHNTMDYGKVGEEKKNISRVKVVGQKKHTSAELQNWKLIRWTNTATLLALRMLLAKGQLRLLGLLSLLLLLRLQDLMLPYMAPGKGLSVNC